MGGINTVIDSGIRTITFTDLDGHVFSKFRINPTDIRLGQRAMESADFFATALKEKPDTMDGTVRLNKDLEDKISYILGYDSSGEIFGEISAFTVLPDGSLFVEHVVDKLFEVAEPATKARKQALQERMDSYTSKYK